MDYPITYTTLPQLPLNALFSSLSFTDALTLAKDAPVNHIRFGDTIGSVQVTDCRTGESVSVADQLLRLLRGRLYGEPYLCRP